MNCKKKRLNRMKTIKTTLKTALDSIHCLNRFNSCIESIQRLSWLECRNLPIRLIVLISYICSSHGTPVQVYMRNYMGNYMAIIC